MMGSSMPNAVPNDGHFDKRMGRSAPSLKFKKSSGKLIRRPLFQDPNTSKVEALEVTGVTVLQAGSTQTEAEVAVAGAAGVWSKNISGAEAAIDDLELVPSVEEEDLEAILEAEIADYEKEDTLLYTEEDLLDDLAFRVEVDDIQSLTATDRDKINAEFDQSLEKCRAARQVKTLVGSSKTSSRTNTPIRGVSFKKVLAFKGMSPRKTPKQKVVKEDTLKEKDKIPMRF